MPSKFRFCCPNCKEIFDAPANAFCPKCKQPVSVPEGGMIQIYRKGSPLGVADGFGIYLNGQPCGFIGNKETVCIPLPYGRYTVHIARGMNRKCNDPVVDLTPQNPVSYMKVYMKPGFWSNSFVLEPSTPEEMPPV
ncbi:MAG: hypothetical protein IJO64_07160 [Clostridia bacterium]|nr:hypothetical protein [Clostridia bacterium]